MTSEHYIENVVMRRPEQLGFPGADSIRNVRVAWNFGRVDVMLFPRKGKVKLVLVEAKRCAASDSICKVIGQLLMYYAGALMMGADGLQYYTDFARDNATEAKSRSIITPKKLTGISPPAKAWKSIASGKKLQPGQVALYVALDSDPHPALRKAVRHLRAHHRLPIGICVINKRKCRIIIRARSPISGAGELSSTWK